MKRRNLLYRRVKKSGDYTKYKIARNKLVNDMRKAKSAYFKTLNPKNPKEFWRVVKVLNKNQSSILTLSKDLCIASTGPEKANLLSAHFFLSVSTVLFHHCQITFYLRYQIPIIFHLNFCAMQKKYVSYYSP